MANRSGNVLDVEEIRNQTLGELFLEHRWTLYLIAIDAIMFAVAFALDTLGGPITDQTKTIHIVAGMIGAYAAGIGIFGGIAIWAVVIYPFIKQRF